MPAPTSDALAQCFNNQFMERYGVQCLGGFAEPEYRPGTQGQYAQLRYTYDYAASVLHEISHWCIADLARHNQVDFGYWYLPPPRTPAQQQRFFQVELKVQSLEAVFAWHTGVKFAASMDDVSQAFAIGHSFAEQIARQAASLCSSGQLPPRALTYLRALVAQGLANAPLRRSVK